MKLSAVMLSLVSLAAASQNVTLTSRQSTTYTDYLAVYFKGEGLNQEAIYMSVSNNNNPASWTAVNGGNLVLQSTVGTKGARDPSLIRSQDGKTFWIIATDLNVYATGVYDTTTGSKGIVVWESTDLKNWSSSALRIISPSNAGMTWAPDAIWDPTTNQYLVFWTCALAGDGWYIMKSYTSDFKTFSTAQKFMSGAGMDATIALDKSTNTFYRITKNGPNNLIEEAKATSLSGTWTVVKDQIGSGTIPAGEGPAIFQDNQTPSKWHLLIDDYTRGRGYAPFETTNIAAGNWVASTGYSLPANFRHGYVVPITSAQRSCITGGSCTSSGGSDPGTGTGTGTSSGTVAEWGQCGGIGWTGGTVCVSPYKCVYENDYYSQCQ